METIGRIRREHLVKGKSIREIARDLNVSRNTVRKVLRSGAPPHALGGGKRSSIVCLRRTPKRLHANG